MEGIKNSEKIREWKWTIKPFYKSVMKNMASSVAKDAVVTINGNEHVYPISKTVIENDFFKHYIEIEDEPIGDVDRIVLRNEDEAPLAVGEGNIEKDNEGWHMAFKFCFKEKVVNNGWVC